MQSHFIEALSMFGRIDVIAMLVFGVVVGTIFSAIPGLTSTLALALLLPFTFNMDMFPAFVMLVGMYGGGLYGGALTAISLNIPGAPGSVCTALDGHPLFEKGQGGKAIGLATVASVIGGVISAIILTLAAPQLARVALRFGPPELFGLTIFGMTSVIAIGGDMMKGALAGLFGLLLGTMGVDLFGSFRFTFGITTLLMGTPLLPTVVGLFAMGKVFQTINDGASDVSLSLQANKVTRMEFPTLKELNSLRTTILRSSLIGTFIGFLPGAGGNIAAFSSYNVAQRLSKEPEKFGKGSFEGLTAAEAANNAVPGGALIPMITLGIPGCQFTAVLLGAFIIHGLPIGPLLFRENQSLIYVIFMATFLMNFVFLAIGYFGSSFVVRVASVRQSILIPIIAAFSMIGAYASASNVAYMAIGVIFGVIAMFMARFDVPVAPIVLGLVLSRLIENSLVQSLIMSDGSLSIFFTRPISLFLLVLAAIFVILPLISARKKRIAENLSM